MKISCASFGLLSDGREAVIYTLENGAVKVQLTNYGAAIVSLVVADRGGKAVDVVLGCDTAADYERQTACLGATPGRHANRIGKGVFTLGSKSYSLFVNNGENHLHGGREGFDKKLWDHAVCDDSVVFYLQSPDGEEGYPGTLQVSVTFTLSENGSLTLEYKAVSDADTVINLTNHSYFNLNGHNSGTVLGQQLQIYSDSFTENDNQCLPTGRILPVEGTPLDFRQAKAIGQEIDSPDINLLNCGGYDHNYVLANPNGLLQSCARAHSEATGIFLLCKTTQPGLQFYSANFLHTCNVKGKGGAVYPKHGGFCLEAQHYPNAMANPDFPSVVLQGGETYRQCIEFVFSAGE